MTVVKRNKRAKPDPELLKLADSLLANYQKPEDLIGENDLLKQLTKMLVERALETEMTDHLGHDKSGEVTNGTGNTRNGHSTKPLKGDFGGKRDVRAVVDFPAAVVNLWFQTESLERCCIGRPRFCYMR